MTTCSVEHSWQKTPSPILRKCWVCGHIQIYRAGGWEDVAKPLKLISERLCETPSLWEKEQSCSFCGKDLGVSREKDGNGKEFYCCGACWASVLHGGIVPDDITPLLGCEKERKQS